jgi:hypothetical protein
LLQGELQITPWFTSRNDSGLRHHPKRRLEENNVGRCSI